MLSRIHISSRELRDICPKVFAADGFLKSDGDDDPLFWDYFLVTIQWDGNCMSWADYYNSLDENGELPDEEDDDSEREPVRFGLRLYSRRFYGTHLDGYGMYPCEESLRSLLEELNRIDCDVLMSALKEHLSIITSIKLSRSNKIMLQLSLPRAFDPQDSTTYPSDGSVCLVVIHRVGEPITKVPPLNDMALVRFVQEDGGAAFVDEHGAILCAATSTLNDAYQCLYFEVELEEDDGVSQEKIDLIESFFAQL